MWQPAGIILVHVVLEEKCSVVSFKAVCVFESGLWLQEHPHLVIPAVIRIQCTCTTSCIHTYIHTSIHTSIHTYIHTYIHTRVSFWKCRFQNLYYASFLHSGTHVKTWLTSVQQHAVVAVTFLFCSYNNFCYICHGQNFLFSSVYHWRQFLAQTSRCGQKEFMGL